MENILLSLRIKTPYDSIDMILKSLMWEPLLLYSLFKNCYYLRGGVLFAMMINLAFPWRRVLSVCLYPRQYLPDFITSARRALILSKAFFWKISIHFSKIYAILKVHSSMKTTRSWCEVKIITCFFCATILVDYVNKPCKSSRVG